jgi:hypothetical protein
MPLRKSPEIDVAARVGFCVAAILMKILRKEVARRFYDPDACIAPVIGSGERHDPVVDRLVST